jgi:DNA-binding transcriptional LysR family regulator
VINCQPLCGQTTDALRQLLCRRHIAPSADPIRRDRYTATSAYQRIVLVPFPVFAIFIHRNSRPRASLSTRLVGLRRSLAGIGWIPEALVYRELESGLVRDVLRGYTVKPLDVHAVYASARHLPPKIRAFVEFLQAELPSIPGFEAA